MFVKHSRKGTAAYNDISCVRDKDFMPIYCGGEHLWACMVMRRLNNNYRI